MLQQLALSQGTVQISWQAQHFRRVRYAFRGRRSTFAMSVQISWQFIHEGRYRFRGRRSAAKDR